MFFGVLTPGSVRCLQGLPVSIYGMGAMLAQFRYMCCGRQFSSDNGKPESMGMVGRVFVSGKVRRERFRPPMLNARVSVALCCRSDARLLRCGPAARALRRRAEGWRTGVPARQRSRDLQRALRVRRAGVSGQRAVQNGGGRGAAVARPGRALRRGHQAIAVMSGGGVCEMEGRSIGIRDDSLGPAGLV